MSTKTETASSGIGFGGLLALLFITLKLLDKIDWSWWWVLSPFWIPLAIVALVVVFCLIMAGIAYLLGK